MTPSVEVNRDRRRERSLQEWAQIVALLINFGGLVWFAANLNASVGSLQAVVTKQNTFLDRLNDRINAHDVTIAILTTQLAQKK